MKRFNFKRMSAGPAVKFIVRLVIVVALGNMQTHLRPVVSQLFLLSLGPLCFLLLAVLPNFQYISIHLTSVGAFAQGVLRPTSSKFVNIT